MSTFSRKTRQGLPRVAGGAPWPLAEEPRLATHAAEAALQHADVPTEPVEQTATVTEHAGRPSVPQRTGASPAAGASRRGLPREPGGDPWPPASAASSVSAVSAASSVSAANVANAVSAASAASSADSNAHQAAPSNEKPVVKTPPVSQPATPVSSPRALVPDPEPLPVKKEPTRSPAGKARKVLIGGGVLCAAGIIVLAARGVTTLPGVPEFLAQFPGEYAPAMEPTPGFPAWARWTHFLNIFFMMLIVRTGLQVRSRQKPPAFWSSRRGGRRLSIYLWLHTSIDVLWLANGVAFVVLLFVSGHWARIVPTSWEVVPNALSAGLQYLTLDWPLEDGWVNYNSLQQLMYFIIVFLAAPLAAITGVRMSEWWPKKATTLSRFFPVEVARKLHFPTMLFFVFFVVVHVFLVFTTGALKNLNHMFAGTAEESWVGFMWFAVGSVITVAAALAAKPMVLAPIASIFGKVSSR